LLGRLTEAVEAWENKKVQRATGITEAVNELLVAKSLLQGAECDRVEYEPALERTERTIDFLLHNKRGQRIYYDVKTVHPDDADAWGLYERAKTEGWLAPGTDFVAEKEWMGPQLFHYAVTARDRFIEHTLALEQKIRHVSTHENTHFRMVFCSDRFRWHRDELEDFADLYFTGHCAWDHFAKMQEHSMGEKKQAFERTIHGFCYFERAQRRPEPTAFVCDVRVPRFSVPGGNI
jgi:hypothetical protein